MMTEALPISLGFDTHLHFIMVVTFGVDQALTTPHFNKERTTPMTIAVMGRRGHMERRQAQNKHDILTERLHAAFSKNFQLDA